MTVALTEQTRCYIVKRVEAGANAAQIRTELETRGVRVPFAQLLDFDPERKGEADRFIHLRDENRDMMKRAASANRSPNTSVEPEQKLLANVRKRRR